MNRQADSNFPRAEPLLVTNGLFYWVKSLASLAIRPNAVKCAVCSNLVNYRIILSPVDGYRVTYELAGSRAESEVAGLGVRPVIVERSTS